MADEIVDGGGGEACDAINGELVEDFGGAAEAFGLRGVGGEHDPVSCLENEKENYDPGDPRKGPESDHKSKPIGPDQVHQALHDAQKRKSHNRPIKLMPDRSGTQESGGGSEDQKRGALSDTQPNQTDAEGNHLGNGIKAGNAAGITRCGAFRLALHGECGMPDVFDISRVPLVGMFFPMAVGDGENESHDRELDEDLIAERGENAAGSDAMAAEEQSSEHNEYNDAGDAEIELEDLE